MTMFRTWARHIAAAIIGGIGTWLITIMTGLGIGPEEAQATVDNLELLITTIIMIILYAVFEKLLKPIWSKTFGENQVEEVKPKYTKGGMLVLMLALPLTLMACGGGGADDHRGGNGGAGDYPVADTLEADQPLPPPGDG